MAEPGAAGRLVRGEGRAGRGGRRGVCVCGGGWVGAGTGTGNGGDSPRGSAVCSCCCSIIVSHFVFRLACSLTLPFTHCSSCWPGFDRSLDVMSIYLICPSLHVLALNACSFWQPHNPPASEVVKCRALSGCCVATSLVACPGTSLPGN